MTYILYDLNAMDPVVGEPNSLMLKDTKVIVQEVWRLLTTDEGSIPNFRSYGLSIKKFSQYPLTKQTATSIFNYVKDRVAVFVDSAEILRADSDVNFEKGELYFVFYLRAIPTGEIVALPTFIVKVGGGQG